MVTFLAVIRYRRISYNLNVMRPSACLVFNPIVVDNYAEFFNCFSFAPGFSKFFGTKGSPSTGSLLNLCVLGFDSSWCLL